MQADMNNPPASPQPINLFIKNESDTTFDVIYAHFTTIGWRNRVKRYVKFGPQVASNKLLLGDIVTLSPGKLQGGFICDNFAQPEGL